MIGGNIINKNNIRKLHNVPDLGSRYNILHIVDSRYRTGINACSFRSSWKSTISQISRGCHSYSIIPCTAFSWLFVKMSNISRSHKVSYHARRTHSRPLFMSPSQAISSLPPIENGIDHVEPSWFESYKWFFFSSYFNALLVFVPLSALAHHLNWDVSLRFGFSFLAIVPLAKVFIRQQMMELC